MIIQKNQDGFIALISVIIISVLLLTLAVTVSTTGILGRFNILDSESKERSGALAEACADKSILETTQGIYSTNKIVNVGPTSQDSCTIISAILDSVTGQTTIKTQSIINRSYSNLSVIIDANYNILSWEEIAHF
jgi:hypothetical protein